VPILIYILKLQYLPGKFSGYSVGGGLGMHYSPFTHTLCISWVGPYTRVCVT